MNTVLYFSPPGSNLRLGLYPHNILTGMIEGWSEEERMEFARALISEITNTDLVMEIFKDRCVYCGKNLLHLAGNDKRCYCQAEE